VANLQSFEDDDLIRFPMFFLMPIPIYMSTPMHTPVPTALKVHTMDSGIGNITAALRQRQMWSTTLIVMSSDNGGREDKEFGGNNWPLRGMKFSDFEGGVRVAAFASGGVIPKARRGAV